MKLRFVIIDEPIHIYNPVALHLWQKAIWAKELGYREQYKVSILPASTDDFFATHAIIAEELPSGKLNPVVMYKIVRRSQCERFHVPFGAQTLLKGTKFENSKELAEVLKDPSEISYDSSWSINPDYKKDKDLSKVLREYVTTIGCYLHLSQGYQRWLTAGVVKFKIDQYFAWLGCQELLPEFQLSIIDEETVRMYYMADSSKSSIEAKSVAGKYIKEWENRIEFYPQTKTIGKAA